MMRLIGVGKKDYSKNSLKYRKEAFILDGWEWDSFDSRFLRYHLYTHYFTNTIYSSNNVLYSLLRAKKNLYKFVRGIYNPVERIVEGYVSFAYAGNVDIDNLSRGAIPLNITDKRLEEGIRDLFVRTNIRALLRLYARQCALYGDAFLKIIDIPDRKTVKIEVVDPRKVVELKKNALQEITYAKIAYNRMELNSKGEEEVYLYEEVITPTKITTYKDGESFAYPDNPEGKASWDIPYGFVPLSHAKFRDVGRMFGYNAFHSQMPKIDEVADNMSLLGDNLRNAVEQIFHAKDIAKGTLDTNSDEVHKDDIRIIYTQGGDIVPLADTVPFQQANQVIDSNKKDIAQDTPVLALHTLRDMSQISAAAVRASFSDAIARINEFQANLDSALSEAIAMALVIMGQRGYGPSVSLDPTERGFSIQSREVINDSMSNLEIVTLLTQFNSDNPAWKLTLEQMGFTEDQIDEVEKSFRQHQDYQIEKAVVMAEIQQSQTISNAENVAKEAISDIPKEDDQDTENIPFKENLEDAAE